MARIPAKIPATTAAAPATPVSRPIWATEPVARRISSGTAMSANESPATDSVCEVRNTLDFPVPPQLAGGG